MIRLTSSTLGYSINQYFSILKIYLDILLSQRLIMLIVNGTFKIKTQTGMYTFKNQMNTIVTYLIQIT